MAATAPPAPPSASRLLGQILLAAGAVSAGTLESALAEQRTTRERLGIVLQRRGTDADQVARGLARQLRLEYAAPPLRPARDALALVDAKLAARLRVVPLALSEARLRVAMADPLDAGATDDLRFRTGRRIEAVVATPMAVDAALSAYHTGTVDALLERLPGARPDVRAEAPEVSALRRASEAGPIIALVDLVLTRAVQARASDVHVEPSADALVVRVRVDGVLQRLMELPRHAAGALVSRVKIMADLDIAVKRRPQDGRATLAVDGRVLTFRVSTLPANGGEKVVLRILDPDGAAQPLDGLGMDADHERAFRRLLGASHGVVLVTGPTGSGKTTTLYAALSSLDRLGRNIITLEDPVEYRLPGVTQVQVHRKAGLSFANALRAVLRQDPDIIMVGELRDRETVETAMAAALTGHLVLATLHTNDAPTAATRLAEMGAAPWLIAGALLGVLAQRLARRLCPHCRAARPATAEELATLAASGPVEIPVSGHCPQCDDGHRGRLGIFELLTVDDAIRSLILRRASADAIGRAARNAGMVTLAEDARAKVLRGATTLGEVRPLLQLLKAGTACPGCHAAVRPAFLHCPACGGALLARCACRARIEPGWRHCPRCGTPAPKNGGKRNGGA